MTTRLWPLIEQLRQIKKHWFLGSAFQAELDRVTRVKFFRFRSSHQWMMMLATRDLLVIHLASWARGQYLSGGLFGQLMAHHLTDFQRPKHSQKGANKEGDDDDDGEQRLAYRRLFPADPSPQPRPEDIEALRARFVALVKPLVEDRHQNRAHLYETPAGAGRVSMLNFDQLGVLFQQIEQIFLDLALVADGACLNVQEDDHPSETKVTAEDSTDHLLLGGHERIERVRCGLPREQYYNQLHELHDSLEPTGELFNQVEMVTPWLAAASVPLSDE